MTYKKMIFSSRLVALLVFLVLLLQSTVNAAEIFLMDEESLKKEALNSPTIKNINASFLASKFSEAQLLEKFQPQLEGDISHFVAQQNTVAPFPITSPINNLSLGITKDFSTGMSLGVFNIMNKRKYGSFGSDARTTLAAEFSMDLYRDIFGRTSKAEISYLSFEKEIAQIQSKIDQKIFLINLTKIYWSLILNEEALKISQNLLKISKKQELDAKKRFRDNIADSGEVSRQISQTSSRQTDIYNLQNQKELYILSLKELLPTIANKKVELKKYNFAKKEREIQDLISAIKSNKNPPMNLTYYDDIIKYITKSYKQQKKITNSYADVDFELYSRYEKSQRDNAISNTFGDVHNYQDNNYEVGLRLKVPLGSAKKSSKAIKKDIERDRYFANRNQNMAKIESYHSQTILNISILTSALESQKNNISNLKESLRVSNKKFNQARIPLRDLIEDQNLYFQSLLNAVGLKSLIINQALNYATIFTDIDL